MNVLPNSWLTTVRLVAILAVKSKTRIKDSLNMIGND